ncbi:MAG: HDIG domain-containing protein [Synergistes sp.]|nr:HDIG domain-containing protein [Synergistes sp.]
MTEEERISRLKESFRSILCKFVLKRENRPYILFRLILLCSAALLICCDWYFFDQKVSYVVGKPAERTYYAISWQRYVDEAATLQLRNRSAERVVSVMVQDEKISEVVNHRLEEIENEHYNKLFNKPLLEIFNAQNEKAKINVKESVLRIGRKVRNEAKDRDEQTSLIWRELKKTSLPQSERNIVFQMLDAILSTSLQPDADMVEKLRSDVSSEISSVIKELHPGSVIVHKGQIITPEAAEILRFQGYPEAKFPWRHLIFILALITVWSSWPIWISDGLRREDRCGEKGWLYIAVVMVVVWVLEALVFRTLGCYSMGVIGLAGWLCMTLPTSLAFHVILGGGTISTLIAFYSNPSVICVGCFVSAASACFGRILFSDPPDNRALIWKKLCGMCIGMGFLSVCVYTGLGFTFELEMVAASVFSGCIWALLVIALLPVWENTFDVLSPLRLVELCNLSQKMIKDMEGMADGTYNHVIMTGRLAGAAADELKMNGLLVRAGAYCHDIGKLKNPLWFVENQKPNENIHDKLPPSVSVRMIMSHVKDGLEKAEEYNIPSGLRRFISEHHGTTLQKYFYEKARALGENVREEDFRYAGPRPQSRETALVMLADSVEAAVKSRKKPFETDDEARKFIYDVFMSKESDGQLDDVDFTKRDFAKIADAFIAVFKSGSHTREVKDLSEIMADAKAIAKDIQLNSKKPSVDEK